MPHSGVYTNIIVWLITGVIITNQPATLKTVLSEAEVFRLSVHQAGWGNNSSDYSDIHIIITHDKCTIILKKSQANFIQCSVHMLPLYNYACAIIARTGVHNLKCAHISACMIIYLYALHCV